MATVSVARRIRRIVRHLDIRLEAKDSNISIATGATNSHVCKGSEDGVALLSFEETELRKIQKMNGAQRRAKGSARHSFLIEHEYFSGVQRADSHAHYATSREPISCPRSSLLLFTTVSRSQCIPGSSGLNLWKPHRRNECRNARFLIPVDSVLAGFSHQQYLSSALLARVGDDGCVSILSNPSFSHSISKAISAALDAMPTFIHSRTKRQSSSSPAPFIIMNPCQRSLFGHAV